MSTAEDKPAWPPLRSVRNMLDLADSIAFIEFYISKSDNRDPELNCRSPSLSMTKPEAESLAAELNAAIKPILQKHHDVLANKAANALRRYCDDTSRA